MELIKQFNNGQVIGVANKGEIPDLSFSDAPLLRSLDFTDPVQSLGLLQLFETMGIVKVPFLRDAIKQADYLYVDGYNGSFKYEIPMDVEYPCVVDDVSEDDFNGIDGSVFPLKLTHAFKQGDILTYDPIDGEQVIVSTEYDVVDEGNGFVHMVTLVERDRKKYFPKSKLVSGTEFMKIDHVAGEYDTEFSGLSHAGVPSTVELEYRMGDIRGVEVAYTDYANSLSINGKETSYVMEQLMKTKYNLGDADYLFVGKMQNNKVKITRIDDLLAALAMAELQKMTACGIMFNRGATITGINGSKRVNEGLYHQLRRGHRYRYSTIQELKGLIKRAADTIFHGSPIMLEDRQLTFKAGRHAYEWVRELFKEEFQSTYPIFLDQDGVPVPLLMGKDRYNLTYKTFAIQEAFLNGIGNVRVEHDPSLDYDMGDYISRGYQAGLSKRSWSMVIWDATDSKYSNVLDNTKLPKGVEVDQRSMGNNLYIVKPKNVPDISFGTRTGRMSGTNVQSAMKHRGEEFWCFSGIEGWVKDLSRVVLIEKKDTFMF